MDLAFTADERKLSGLQHSAFSVSAHRGIRGPSIQHSVGSSRIHQGGPAVASELFRAPLAPWPLALGPLALQSTPGPWPLGPWPLALGPLALQSTPGPWPLALGPLALQSTPGPLALGPWPLASWLFRAPLMAPLCKPIGASPYL